MDQNETWLSRKAAAIYLTRIGCTMSRFNLAYLATKNNHGKGPPFFKSSRKSVRYKQSDLDAWAKAKMKKVE